MIPFIKKPRKPPNSLALSNPSSSSILTVPLFLGKAGWVVTTFLWDKQPPHRPWPTPIWRRRHCGKVESPRGAVETISRGPGTGGPPPGCEKSSVPSRQDPPPAPPAVRIGAGLGSKATVTKRKSRIGGRVGGRLPGDTGKWRRA